MSGKRYEKWHDNIFIESGIEPTPQREVSLKFSSHNF